MPGTPITLDEAVELTRTGDVWVFRGRSVADRAIQVTTNSPVNHVGMAVVIEDLPPLMWHAELGRSLPDLWSGTRQRGVQLHDLRAAVLVWGNRYGQRAWLRQLEKPVTRQMEDAVLRTIARLDGTPFPSTSRLALRWLGGRLPALPRPRLRPLWRLDRTAPDGPGAPAPAAAGVHHTNAPSGPPDATAPAGPPHPAPAAGARSRAELKLEATYCAEVVALTYQAMGLLPGRRRSNWYDAGSFWSGDELALAGGFRLGHEIAVRIPDTGPHPGLRAS